MGSKIKILIGILVLGILLIGAWWVWNSIIPKKEPFIPPHWKICNSDSDCVETQAGCCRCTMGGVQTAINKKYLNKWEEKLKKFCQGTICPAVFRCKKGKVICKNHKCKFVPRENKVILTTDKTEYEKDEEIKLTLINDFDKPIYYRDWSKSWNECGGSSFKLGKKVKENEFDFFGIGGIAECLKPIVSLKPHTKITYSLDPKELEEIPSRRLEKGTYKWEFTFGFEKDLKTTQKIYSNEFTIKNCSLLAEQIREKISKANYCEKDEDCIIVSFGCPFGCYNLINKKEVEAIRLLVKKYDECGGGTRCVYRCPTPPENVRCENGVCVSKPSKKSIWTERIREKYCGNYSHVLQEKISKIKPKPRGVVFHEITIGEILRITKEKCNYRLSISPLEEIYVPYIGKRIELFHPKQLYYIGDCNESLNLKEGDKFIAFSIRYEINDTFHTWAICINKIENYEEAVKLPEEKELIKFEITNLLNQSIYVPNYDKGIKIYQLKNNKWEELQIRAFCGPFCSCICEGCPLCSLPPPSCIEIKPGKVLKWSWGQKKIVNSRKLCGITFKECLKEEYVKNGRYKVQFCYSLSYTGNLTRMCIPDKDNMKCLEKEFDIPFKQEKVVLKVNE